MVNKILFITLSNIGDVILTLPVLDCLVERFPQSKVTVMIGVRPKEILENNPKIEKIIIFDKDSRLRDKIKLLFKLEKERFDVVVDLRNSLFGLLLTAKYKTSPFRFVPSSIVHMKERHLYKSTVSATKRGEISPNCKQFGGHGLRHKSWRDLAKLETIWRTQSTVRVNHSLERSNSLYIKPEDERYIKDILKQNNVNEGDRIIIISPGARSHIKRWPKEKFVELVDKIVEEFKTKIILAGDKDDSLTAKYIIENSNNTNTILDLTAKTTISQLAYLIKKANLVITNDSAALHLASYLEERVLAIFGPTNELKYGPWTEKSSVVKKDIFCRPCEKAQCKFGNLKCMHLIKVEDVMRQVENIFVHSPRSPLQIVARSRQIGNNLADTVHSRGDNFKRILIVRTDRIGDVLLSTPVIKALRDAYPNAYIAMMVSPYTKEIIDGNPNLDAVIIYDKDSKHKSWMRTLKFSRKLSKQKFDLALILHPTNRAHSICFLAGIKRRIGYARKLGCLLTDRIAHIKQYGLKHELEYTLDLVRYLGIEPKDKNLFIAINQSAEDFISELFSEENIGLNDKLLAIHPAASCPSKIWPAERFAKTADKLAELYGFKVLILSGPKDIKIAQDTASNMKHKAINLAGKTSISQLASILKRCALFISNDSGPVHIAVAVGTPVISIFGRNQQGLSPDRWGPLGAKNKVLHKEVGCVKCLAHNCLKEFACLKAISVDDVLTAAEEILIDN